MSRASILRGAVAASALAALSCDTNFAPQYLVRDLRVLAARAEVVGAAPFADADAGETLRLSALVANPQRLPGVTVRWKACLPVPEQAVSPCRDAAALRDPDAITGPDVVDLGEGATVDLPVPAELAPALRALIDRATARPELACTLYLELPVLVIASAPGATTRIAVKTTRLTPWREVRGTGLANAYARNANPDVAFVRSHPSDPDACTNGADALSAGEQQLCVALARLVDAPDPHQPFNDCLPDGTREPDVESIDFQWYVTGGTFTGVDTGVGDNGNVTAQQVAFTPPAGPFTLWVIARDGRGGVGWLQRQF